MEIFKTLVDFNLSVMHYKAFL